MIDSLALLRGITPLLVACLSGCGALDNCPEGLSEPVRITTGTSDRDALTYESVGWSGPLDAFPAKSALVFEHGLGFTPALVEPYLSFKPEGTHDADGGSVALTAGNQSLIDCVDSSVIVIRNDTCEKSFYIRVFAYGVSKDDREDRCSKALEP
jgi:hypothetical protein